MLNFTQLKELHRAQRNQLPVNLNLRIHRALSWLDRAEKAEGDQDAQFIFLWIAFNAAYAHEINNHQRFSEQETFQNFIALICQLDIKKQLDDMLWNEFSSSIRLLLANKFVFKPFWDFQNNIKKQVQWKQEFSNANAFANRALGKKDTSAVLSVVFSRLYTLRNQTIHGGSTYNSQVNRTQLRDGVAFLNKFTPLMIDLMLSGEHQLWGEPCYPVIEE